MIRKIIYSKIQRQFTAGVHSQDALYLVAQIRTIGFDLRGGRHRVSPSVLCKCEGRLSRIEMAALFHLLLWHGVGSWRGGRLPEVGGNRRFINGLELWRLWEMMCDRGFLMGRESTRITGKNQSTI